MGENGSRGGWGWLHVCHFSAVSLLPTLVSHGSTHLAAKGPEHPHDANLRVSIRDTEKSEKGGEWGFIRAEDQEEGSVVLPPCVIWQGIEGIGWAHTEVSVMGTSEPPGGWAAQWLPSAGHHCQKPPSH